MEKELKILIVEDVAEDIELLTRELHRAGIRCAVHSVDTEPDFLRELRAFGPDLILSDFSLPQFSGVTALALAHAARPDTPFIFVSGTIGEEQAINCLKQGAVDYVLKDNPRRLASAVQRALGDAREREARRQAEQELHDASARLSALTEEMQSGVLYEDARHRVLYCNPQFRRMFGIEVPPSGSAGTSARDITRRMSSLFVAPEQFLARTNAVINGKLAINGEELLLADGRSFERDAIPLVVEGRYLGHWWQYRDVTGHKTQLYNIIRLNRVQTILSNINATIVRVRERGELFDAACRIAVEHGGFRLAWIGTFEGVSLNLAASAGDGEEHAGRTAAAARLDGSPPAHPFGRALAEAKPYVCNDIAAEEALGPWRDEALRQGDASVALFPLLLAGKVIGLFGLHSEDPHFFDQGEIDLLTKLVGQIAFALDHIDKEERLDYLAFYDPLTGLPNRTLFFDRVNQFLPTVRQDNRRAALLVVSLNRFKSINDNLGYHVGDALLREVAQRLSAVLREDDTIARSGGDHFLIGLNRIPDETAVGKIVVEKILESLDRPFDIQGHSLRTSATIGVAVYPSDGANAEALLRCAENALERARESAAHYAFYSPEIDARISETLAFENRLYSAIQNREFRLHYQPKVDLKTGQICGVEALLRWYAPHNGVIAPAEFIPLLEKTGMIREVGKWVLQEAASQCRQWQAQGLPPVKIAVNVSPLQLAQEDFVDEARRVLAGSFPDHWGVDIEITESVIMGDLGKTRGKLLLLRKMGIEISIDDFGTGYSSLSYINKLPISSLKIDRSFIIEATRDPNGMAIVSAIISLAHALNLKVVAEGVETEEQLRLLKLLRCDEMQGYLFSKPVPQDEFGAMLKEHRVLS